MQRVSTLVTAARARAQTWEQNGTRSGARDVHFDLLWVGVEITFGLAYHQQEHVSLAQQNNTEATHSAMSQRNAEATHSAVPQQTCGIISTAPAQRVFAHKPCAH